MRSRSLPDDARLWSRPFRNQNFQSYTLIFETILLAPETFCQRTLSLWKGWEVESGDLTQLYLVYQELDCQWSFWGIQTTWWYLKILCKNFTNFGEVSVRKSHVLIQWYSSIQWFASFIFSFGRILSIFFRFYWQWNIFLYVYSLTSKTSAKFACLLWSIIKLSTSNLKSKL